MFQDIKKLLISDLLLAHFSPSAEIVIASDASEYSIETVLLHKYNNYDMKAVIHTSCSLIAVGKKLQSDRESRFINYFCHEEISQMFPW